jgi:hypothetical protein
LRPIVIRKRVGSAYEMYNPTVATDTMAWNATKLPSDCTHSQNKKNLLVCIVNV